MRKTTDLVVLVITVMAMTISFSAVTKADTSSWALDRCNTAGLCVAGGDGTINLATSGSGSSEVIDVTVTAISGFGFFGSGKGGGAFGFNFDGNDAGVGVTNVDSPFSFSGNSGQMDGWGSFEFIINGPSGSGATSPITFTVTCAGGCTSVSQLAGELSSGGNGSTYFAAHIRNNSTGLTGFVAADQTHNATTPEPGSLALLGSGLLAMGGVLRRRLIG